MLFCFVFLHFHQVSDACTCTITKIKLTNKKGVIKRRKAKHIRENREEMNIWRVWVWGGGVREWRKIGSHNRERQRERQLKRRGKIDLTLVHMQSVEDP